MSFESDLTTFIGNQSSITALIGVPPKMRFYPTTKPQGVIYPCVMYQRINTGRVYSHQGDSRLEYPRYQFTIEDMSALPTQNVAQAFIDVLSGYKGTMGTTRVDSIIVANELDDYDPAVKIYKRLVDLIIWFSEA